MRNVAQTRVEEVSLARDVAMAALAAVLGAGVVVAGVLFGLKVEIAEVPVVATTLAAVEQAPPTDPVSPPVEAAPTDCPTLLDAKAPWLVTSLEEPVPVEAFAEPASPKSLERRVKFWMKVWGETPDHVYLLVDERRPWVVYGEADCRPVWEDPSLDEDQKKEACGVVLNRGRGAAQRSIAKSLPKVAKQLGDWRLAKTAASNIIAIEGKRDDLLTGMDRAALELGMAERIFEHHGVPRSFARLGFVESTWRPTVVSRSGAVGTYQFMPVAGREHMRVDAAVDERLDPLRSASAAARYLKSIAKQFDGDWALALSGYNQGAARMKRVVKALGTRDIGKIADAGDRGSFGFDGQNYYAQMIAVFRLTKDMRFDPLPKVERAVVLAEDMPLAKLATCLARAPAEVLKANPALAVAGDAPAVPKGYVLAVPKKSVTVADAGKPFTESTTRAP